MPNGWVILHNPQNLRTRRNILRDKGLWQHRHRERPNDIEAVFFCRVSRVFFFFSVVPSLSLSPYVWLASTCRSIALEGQVESNLAMYEETFL